MLINFIPRKDFPSGLWVAAFLLCCHMAEKGHLSHVSFYEGTNPIHGASPLWPNYASKASPPNVITLGFGCNIWIWSEGHTNIQFIASVRTRIHNEVVQFTVLFFFFLPYCTAYGQRRQWQSTPELLPGKSHGQRSLIGWSPWGCKESDTTERLEFHFSLSCIGEGNGNPLQCSCLENSRGAWWAAVYGVAQSQTQLKRLSSSTSSSMWDLSSLTRD